MVILLTPNVLNTAMRSFETNERPLSVHSFDGLPYFATMGSRKMRATVAAFVLVVGIASVRLVYRPVITATNYLPCFAFGSGPNISVSLYFCELRRKTPLPAINTYSAYGSMRKNGSHVLQRIRYRAYETSTTSFSWSRRRDVCYGGRPKTNI